MLEILVILMKTTWWLDIELISMIIFCSSAQLRDSHIFRNTHVVSITWFYLNLYNRRNCTKRTFINQQLWKSLKQVGLYHISSLSQSGNNRMKTEKETRYQFLYCNTSQVCFFCRRNKHDMQVLPNTSEFFTTFWYLLSTTELIYPASFRFYVHRFHTLK